MVSKITFLGTAGDSFVYGKQLRSSGGIVIKTGGYQFIIDPGPGTLNRAKLCNVNLRETTAIIVTHDHVNHASDLNAIIGAMTYNGLDRQGVILANSSIVEGKILSEFHKRCVERVITLKEGQRVGIENLEIHALKAKHDAEEPIGIKLFSPDFVMSYTSDTKYDKELIEQYKKSDIIILNIVHTADEKSDKNLTSDDAIKILKAAKPQLAIITHFGKRMLKEDPMMEARRIQKESGVQVIAATDGMVISPDYYSAEMKQKTLNLYPPSSDEEEKAEEKQEVEEDIKEKEGKEEGREGKAERKSKEKEESKEEEVEEEPKEEIKEEETTSEEKEEKIEEDKEKQSFLLKE